MSQRLQVLIPLELDNKLRKAAQRRGISKGEWVRRAIDLALTEDGSVDPLARMASLGAPTAGLDQMLAEIENGRR